MPRKPYAVWMRLRNGSPWEFCRERTLDEALVTARTLRGSPTQGLPLPFEIYHVWIAAPAVVALKPERARYRRR